MYVIRVRVVAGQTIGQPGLGIVGSDLDHIADQLSFQPGYLGQWPQTAQRNTSWQAPQLRSGLLDLHLERLELGNQASTRGRRDARSPYGITAGSIRSRSLVCVQHQCSA